MREVILGHRGMVGSAIHRQIPSAQVVGLDPDLRHVVPLDLMQSTDVLYLCAARVGGIQCNISEPGAMIYDNLMIQANVIEAARLAGVKLIVFLGSSCIYPAYQSLGGNSALKECDLMTGQLEPTNEPYAIAKIAGIKMLEAYNRQYGMEYLAVMPCNLYGPGDNFDPETSHFIPGMIRKFHDAKISGAKSVTLWGTGTPRREVMHVDDCARIIVELVRKGARGLVNIGPGVDFTITDWAQRIRRTVEYDGRVEWDTTKPDGVARKLLDVSRMRSFDVSDQMTSADGLDMTYRWFLENKA